MKFGLFIPQGWRFDLVGIEPAQQWATMRDLVQHVDRNPDWSSAWVYDHFHTTPQPSDQSTHEAWTLMSAFAAATDRIRLGQMCTCMSYRNPAYLAKVAATVDHVSGGRVEMGIGAGWYEHEWRAYGYGFPTAGDRIGMLDEGADPLARKSLEQSCLNGDNPRQSARQWYEDPAEQYAALEKVLESSSVSNDPVVRARIEDALAELLAEEGDAIHATINSARAATEFAEITQGGASDARAITQTYDDIVFDPERNLARVLNLVVERFPGRPLSGAISAIRRALGDDLSARRQSAPDERLRLLVSDLYYVSVATTVLLTCTQLADRISAQAPEGATDHGLTDEVLMRRIAHWTIDRWLPSNRVTELVDMLPDDGVPARITLMSGLRKITAALPDQRQQLLDQR